MEDLTKGIVFVSGDDWTAMYVDGKKIIDGHKLEYWMVLHALDIKFSTIPAPNVDHTKCEVDYADSLEDVKVVWYD